MANEIFRAISNLRLVLDTETDADSPDNETTYKAIREMIEDLYQILLATGDDGTATQNPPNDNTGVLTDAAGGYSVDEHNGRTLVMTSGLAKGGFYTIDDTTATTLVCTGDNLYADGVRSGDYYVVLYDIKTNTDGHDHDGVNSPNVVLANGSIATAKYASGSVDQTAIGAAAVGQGELKTSQQTITNNGTETITTLTGGEYCFAPSETYAGTFGAYTGAAGFFLGRADVDATPSWNPKYTDAAVSEANYITTYNANSQATLTIKIRYITASGELHWIFFLYDKSGKILAIHEAPDHPSFGNRGIIHPFQATYDPKKHNLTVVTFGLKEYEKIRIGCLPADNGGWLNQDKIIAGIGEDYLKPEKPFMESFFDLYEIDQSNEALWPEDPISIGLPRLFNGYRVDWRSIPQMQFCPEKKKMVPVKISTIKRAIPKPDYVTCLKMKEKNKCQ